MLDKGKKIGVNIGIALSPFSICWFLPGIAPLCAAFSGFLTHSLIQNNIGLDQK